MALTHLYGQSDIVILRFPDIQESSPNHFAGLCKQVSDQRLQINQARLCFVLLLPKGTAIRHLQQGAEFIDIIVMQSPNPQIHAGRSPMTTGCDDTTKSVSYTHLTLPTILRV